MPERIQRKRTRGWRMPEGAVYVGRPSRCGNPWSGAGAGEKFADRMALRAVGDPASGLSGYPSDEEIRAELAGKDLACWCPPGAPCHADVLLRIANGDQSDA